MPDARPDVVQGQPLPDNGVGLSLGTRGEVDQRHLARLGGLVDRIGPCLVSEDLSWSSAGTAYLIHLPPLPYTDEP